MATIENRITPTWPYILPSARRRSGIAARQDARSTAGVMQQPPNRVAPHRFRDFSSGKAEITSRETRHSPSQSRALNSPGTTHLSVCGVRQDIPDRMDEFADRDSLQD